MLKTTTVTVLAAILLTNVSCGQESKVANKVTEAVDVSSVSGLLKSVSITDVLQISGDLRKSSESLEKFGESMKQVSTAVGKAASTTSENMAAMSAEFDPFGFKTAFKTIQLQNAIIERQSQLIQELQQKEILRLQQDSDTQDRPKRRSRRTRRRRR
jgi:hypothetical protein